MSKNDFKIIATLTGALALSGCLAVEEEAPGPLPTADKILPAEYSAAGPGGIGDYFTQGGTWQVNLDGQVQTTKGGTAVLADAMVYDTVNNQWTINLNGANFVLSESLFAGIYNVTGCSNTCYVTLGVLDADGDPATSQYGTFGAIGYLDFLKLEAVELFVHAGLKTAPADMPTSGTGTYAGRFEGAANYSSPDGTVNAGFLEGTASINATFTSAGGTLGFESIGVDNAVVGATYNLSGSTNFSGNTYNGTVGGAYSVDGVTTTYNIDAASNSFSGAFYGPAAAETAGVVDAGDASGTIEIVGGFWAEQTP